jgi:hypothetical protein
VHGSAGKLGDEATGLAGVAAPAAHVVVDVAAGRFSQASVAKGDMEHPFQTFEQATLFLGIHRRALSHTGSRAGLHQESSDTRLVRTVGGQENQNQTSPPTKPSWRSDMRTF